MEGGELSMPNFCVRPGQVVLTHLTHLSDGIKDSFKAIVLSVNPGNEDEYPRYRIRRCSDDEKFTVSFDAIKILRKKETRKHLDEWHRRMKSIG